MNLQEANYLKILGQSVFDTWHQAVYYAIKNKLWGKVAIVKANDLYVIKNKEE